MPVPWQTAQGILPDASTDGRLLHCDDMKESNIISWLQSKGQGTPEEQTAA